MKTNPTGIRFISEQLEFIKKRERIDTPQQVVYFLCAEYCKLYKVEKKSVFDVKEDYKEIISEPPKSEPRMKTIVDYVNERIECDSQYSYNKWLEELENDNNLTHKQKELAKTAQP